MMESRATRRVTMIVLVLNCGSSSLKFQLLAIDRDFPDREGRLARGAIERIRSQATVHFEAEGLLRQETPGGQGRD
ncbi:MAG: hypothetical protein ACREKB_08820 [Candidatus Rokuibacteriota bacterium]